MGRYISIIVLRDAKILHPEGDPGLAPGEPRSICFHGYQPFEALLRRAPQGEGGTALYIKRLNILKSRPQGFRPLSRQHLEIGIILSDALGVLQLQRIGFIGEHVDGKPHAQV